MLLVVVCVLFVFFNIKTNKNIYIGDYSFIGGVTHTRIWIDDKLVFDDSLKSSPFKFILLSKKMRYGFHNIRIISEEKNIDQKEKIFLFINQYITIEYLGDMNIFLSYQDTLFHIDGSFEILSQKNAPKGKDSVFIIFNDIDTLDYKNRFLVASRFEPFRLE